MKLFKYILLLALSSGLLYFSSCEDDFEDENYDFSNSLPSYVELTSGADIATVPGDTVSVTVRLREARDADVNVNYEITGDFTDNGTATVAQGNLNTAIPVIIPMMPDTGMATLTLTGVDNGLTIGRGDPAQGLSATSVNILWEAP